MMAQSVMAELSRSRPPEAVFATPDAGTHAHSVPQCLWTRPGVRGTTTASPTLGKSRIHPLVTKHTIYLEFTTIIKKHNYMVLSIYSETGSSGIGDWARC